MEPPRKEETLPVERHAFGYVQKSVYKQPDLYHEKVVQLDSPFAPVVKTGTWLASFLLLGDQNAGKSTFLHAFTYAQDARFTELTQLLPILSATFVNTRYTFQSHTRSLTTVLSLFRCRSWASLHPHTHTSRRFLPAESTTPPRDELPFLDTDLARGTVLLTLEDFFFWCRENDIDVGSSSPSPDTRFVLVRRRHR
jgi:hypothetical protein